MKSAWKKADWFWTAIVITVAYMVTLGIILGPASIWSFLVTTSELNQVGDFLAGIFAPIALIWLVVAVLTQRQELHETRDQFAANQKIVDEQLKTINSQNSLLALQHTQSVENAKQAYKLSLFDKRFQIYEKFVKFGEEHETKDYDYDSYSEMVNLSQEAAFVFDQSMEDWISDIGQQIYEYVQFKEDNPLPTGDDGYGNGVPTNDQRSEKLRDEYNQFKGWIREQFLPDERIARFWSFMNVSDRPFVGG